MTELIRIRPKGAEREAVAKVLWDAIGGPVTEENCEYAADAILELVTTEVDVERLADATYNGMMAGNSDGHGRGAFLACWSGAALAALDTAGFVVESVQDLAVGPDGP